MFGSRGAPKAEPFGVRFPDVQISDIWEVQMPERPKSKLLAAKLDHFIYTFFHKTV